MAHVRVIAERYGLSDVFVATDDPTVIDRLKEGEKAAGGTLRFVGVEKYRGLLRQLEESKDVWTEDRLRRGSVPAAPLLRSTVVDVMILSRASAFVLHFASNLSRLAYQLAVARTRKPPPYGKTSAP